MYSTITLVGRLTRDPDLQYTQSGTAKVQFTVAVDGRNDNDDTQFWPVVVFGDPAENHDKYLDKGSAVAVQGRPERGRYEDDQGQTMYNPQVNATGIGAQVTYLSISNNNSNKDQDPDTEDTNNEDNNIPF